MEVFGFHPCSQSIILHPKLPLTTPLNHLRFKSLTISAAADADVTTLREVSPTSMQWEPGFLIPKETSPLDHGAGFNAMEYLSNIATSKVYDVADESPLQLSTKLSQRLGVNMWLKREDLQPVLSFKLRGAYHMMAKLTREQLEKGVICSSTGSHAQGVALAAKRLGCDAVVAMPVTTPEIKWKSVERLGATVVLVGDAYDEAEAYAKRRGAGEGRTFIPPCDHPDIIEGQGTVGMEIARQMKDPIHAIFVPVGGGGLIAGISAYIKSVAPEIKVIGVELADANAMALSLYHGERIALDQVGGIGGLVAVKVVGAEPFRLCKDLVDGVVLVNRDHICASMKDMYEEKRTILEPSGALSLAGAEAYCKYYGLKDVNVVAITSVANMNIVRQREVVLATFLPEELGTFKRFCELVGPNNITEIRYRYNSNQDKAFVLYSVGLATQDKLEEMVGRMTSAQLPTINLTNNDLLKDRLRHLMRSRSNVQDELLCYFTLPEMPGALMKLLDTLSPRWNISLFLFLAEGRSVASRLVLVGIQVPHAEMNEFQLRADTLGYEYEVKNE